MRTGFGFGFVRLGAGAEARFYSFLSFGRYTRSQEYILVLPAECLLCFPTVAALLRPVKNDYAEHHDDANADQADLQFT